MMYYSLDVCLISGCGADRGLAGGCFVDNCVVEGRFGEDCLADGEVFMSTAGAAHTPQLPGGKGTDAG
jgi:hypothetical protein